MVYYRNDELDETLDSVLELTQSRDVESPHGESRNDEGDEECLDAELVVEAPTSTPIKVEAFPVDPYAGTFELSFIEKILPSLDALKEWNHIIHEISGYCVYSFLGYL